MANNVKTVFLLGLLTGLILFIGSFWGENGLTIALVVSVLMNFSSYFFSDKIALAMYGAKPISREDAPRLYSILEYLCSRSGIPMPKVYLIPTDSPNAFATGRNPEHASVAVTEGALRLLDEGERLGLAGGGIRAHHEGAGHVRGVAVHDRAKIQEQEVAGRDDTI